MAQVGRSADETSGHLGGLSRSGDDANRSTTGLGRSIGNLGDTVDGTSGGVSGLARGLNSLGEASSLGNVMGRASSSVSMLGLAAAYSAAGSGILTAAVGALGVAGVGALTGVGVAAGLAGGAMTSFALDAHKDSARFGNTLKQMGQQAHLGAQMISEPMAEAVVGLGRSLVTADGHMTQAGMGIANSLKQGFGTAASVINDSSSDIVRSGALAAGGFARLTAEAAPGVRAFLGEMPSLTAGAVSGMSQITQEFGRSAGAIEGATPALNRMMGAAGGLGAELVSIGARSVVPFAEDMTSMTQATTRMANQLEPAIKPSMSAFTDLFGAAAGGIGSLSPEVSGFADTVSRNGPQMESVVNGLGRGMLALGSAAVDGLGQAAPAIAGFGDALEQNQGDIGTLIGDVVGGIADAGSFVSNAAGGVNSFNSLGAKLSDATGGPIAKPGSLNGGAIEHNINSYLNPVGAFKEAFGIGQQPGGGAPPALAAPAPPPPAAGGPQAAPVSRAGVGAAPAAAAPHAFIGPVAPMPDATAGLFTGAAAGQHAAAGSVGSAMQSVIRKTVSQNIPAAEEGGASIGAAMGGGTATGVTSTKTITDTVMRKHIKHMVDVGQSEGDIHSPSGLTRRRLGQPLGEGTALGVQDTFGVNRDAMGGLLGHYGNENTPAPVINIRGGKRPAKMAQDAAAPGAEGGMIRGQAKQVQFGEDPNAVGSKGDAARAVFDKQVMSWDAKPGVDITQIHDMGELNAAIQSPLSGRQYTALNSMQGILDQPGLTRNSQMFGERTEQNIMRNRSGAFDVAGQWANHLEDQKDQAKEVGKSSADGYAQGVNSGLPEAFGAGQNMAEQGHAGYKKKDQQNSPSAVWAGMGGNSVAGIPIGFAAGVPAAVSAMSNSAGTMADVVGGYLSDRGLMAGYTWGESIVTGASMQLKKSDFTSAGLPSQLKNSPAMAALAKTGFLSAGSGASIWKTAGNTPSIVTLAPASSAQPTPVTVEAHFHLEDQVTTIARTVMLDAVDRLTDRISGAPR